MCPPGQYMKIRDKKTCRIDCQPCTGQRYTDAYNLGTCKICDACSKENMEIVSQCNATRNAVCRCKAGFACENEACDYCTAIPTTTAPPAAPRSTTAVSKHEVRPTLQATKPIQDTAWFLIIIGLLCVGLALVIVTKIKPLLIWLKDYCLVRKPVPAPVSLYHPQDEGDEGDEGDEEEACKPVQEVYK
ncbi:CD27 antigen-like [Eucyclogobius newberryi]|uniref:CD27 antigen-like n=1 Tax=Eucyclogobius newberryi TaxID=166745 RepID=UPI003B5A0B4A